MAFPTGWTSFELEIDRSKVGANGGSGIPHFVVPLIGTHFPDEMKTLGGSNCAQSDGGDIRFTSDLLGIIILPCEIVSWAENVIPANATAEIYVQVPLINDADAIANTKFYGWWKHGVGETQPAVGAPYGRNAVWNENGSQNYIGAYHLENAASTDSAGLNDGTPTGPPTATTGKIGGGANFDGTQWITLFNPPNSGSPLYYFNPITVSFWANCTAGSYDVPFCYVGWQNFSILFNGTTIGGANAGALSATVSGMVSTTTLHYYTLTYDAGNPTGTEVIYVDGVSQVTIPLVNIIDASFGPLNIGHDGTNGFNHRGVIDEVRISATVRSQAWITTEYNSINDPTFVNLNASSSSSSSSESSSSSSVESSSSSSSSESSSSSSSSSSSESSSSSSSESSSSATYSAGTITFTDFFEDTLRVNTSGASGGTAPYIYEFQRASDAGGSPGSFTIIGSPSAATSCLDGDSYGTTIIWYRVKVTDNTSNVVYSSSVSTAENPPVYISTDGNGVDHYTMRYRWNGDTTLSLRILNPSSPAVGMPHNFLYVLPVSTDDTAYMDGLMTLFGLNAHNEYNLTIISPNVSTDTGYTNDPTDPNHQYESFMASELRIWVAENFSSGGEKHCLLGFSKSGYGALNLILRRPTVFDVSAAWDFPVVWDAGFNLTNPTVASFAAPFQSVNRIWISGYNLFQDKVVEFDTTLTTDGMLHTFGTEALDAHAWDVGWMTQAVDWMFGNSSSSSSSSSESSSSSSSSESSSSKSSSSSSSSSSAIPAKLVVGTISVEVIAKNHILLTATEPSGGTAPYTYQWVKQWDAGLLTRNGFIKGSTKQVNGSTALIYDDTNLELGLTYEYQLIVTDSNNNVAYSRVYKVRTDSVADCTTNFNCGYGCSPYKKYRGGYIPVITVCENKNLIYLQ